MSLCVRAALLRTASKRRTWPATTPGEKTGSRPVRDVTLARLPDWEPPTPAEVQELLDWAGITPYRAAQIIGVDRRTVGRWRSEGPHRIVPQYAHWRLLLIETRRIDERSGDQ